MEAIAQFQEVLEKEKIGLSGKIDFFIEKIVAQEDLDAQRMVCKDLIRAAKKIKTFKRAKSSQKSWVVKIQNLAERLGLDM
jgi:hypothetical protein